MRGDERLQGGMFSYVTTEQRVPGDHPLREIRRLTDVVLRSLSEEFDSLYSASGRLSIAPEYVLRALLLQAFYSVRSERQLVQQLDYKPAVPLVPTPATKTCRWGPRGLSVWAWTMQYGTTPYFPKSATGC